MNNVALPHPQSGSSSAIPIVPLGRPGSRDIIVIALGASAFPLPPLKKTIGTPFSLNE